MKKLIKIKLNNKQFQIFFNEKIYIYLEIKKDSLGNLYYDYPELQDYFQLCTILYHDAFTSNNVIKKTDLTTQKVKIRIKNAIIIITLYNLFMSGLNYIANNNYNTLESKTTQTLDFDNNAIIDDISLYILNNPTKEDLYSSAESNPNFTEKELEDVKKYIDALCIQFPNINKILLYDALKKIQVESVESFENEYTVGRANYSENKIYIKKGYENFNIFSHELTHFLFSCIVKTDSKWIFKSCNQTLQQDNQCFNYYGNSLTEGINCYVTEKITQINVEDTDGYKQEYYFTKRIMSMLGEEKVLELLINENSSTILEELQVQSGLIEEVDHMMKTSDLINITRKSDVEIEKQDFQKYFDEEMDIFFAIHAKTSFDQYMIDRQIYLQNLICFPNIYPLFFEKEALILNEIQLEKCDQSMIFSNNYINFKENANIKDNEYNPSEFMFTITENENSQPIVHLIRCNDQSTYPLDYFTLTRVKNPTIAVYLGTIIYDFVPELSENMLFRKNTLSDFILNQYNQEKRR